MLQFNITLSFLLLASSFFESRIPDTSIDSVKSAIHAGSSRDLAVYFNESLSLNINGQQGDYSKNQAELVMKDFFRKNQALSFSIIFKSESTPNINSYIGDFQSIQGIFKVMITVVQENNFPKIYSLEFIKG